MRFLKASLIAGLLFSALLPGFASAASCACYCGNYDEGAYAAGTQSSSSDCRGACESLDEMFIGCYASESEYPYNDEKCWTFEDCRDFSRASGSGWIRGDAYTTSQSKWEETRTPYCSTTKSGSVMRYCYPESTAKVSLGVNIGALSEASGIGEYIVAAYDWLIPAAALIAVTMIMIGGLQYAMARGKSTYIDKGKKRIGNAIAGLVLLLSAYVIAKLIDPRLVSFEPLKTPLIKEVTVLSSEESCKTLIDKGFSVNAVSGTTSCGSKGKIAGMDLVKENISTGSWKVGDTCDYTYCGDGVCMSDGTCKLCAEITTPSTATCAQAQELGTGSVNDDTYNYCIYDEDLNTCVSAIFPSMPQGFTCTSLVAYAKEHGTGCETYSQALRIDWSLNGTRNMSTSFESTLGGIVQEVCEDDVNTCQLYKYGLGKSCEYSVTKEDVLFGAITYHTARCEDKL